jgi:hypothetical protein
VAVELADLVARWPNLHPQIKAAMLALALVDL